MIDYQLIKDFEFEELANNEWRVTKYIGFDAENIEIPSEIDSKKIVAIGESIFENDTKIKGVKIQEGIKEIGNNAFTGCKALSHIVLPDSLEKAGHYAFSQTRIEDLSFGSNIRVLGIGVCQDCFNLKRVIFSDSIEEIPEMGFWGCRNLENLVLPKNIKTVGKGAFGICKINHVNLPEGIERLEENAFVTNSIELLIIPKSMKYIGKEAICSVSLKTVVILPGCEVEIESGNFKQESTVGALTSLYIPSSVTKFNDIFAGTSSTVLNHFRKDEAGKVVRDAWGDEVIDSSLHFSVNESIPRNLTIYCEMGSAIMNYAKAKQIKCAEYNAAIASNLDDIKKEAQEKSEDINNNLKYSPDDTLYTLDFTLHKEKFIIGDEGVTVAPNIKVIKKRGGDFAGGAKVYFDDNCSLEIIETGAFYNCFNYHDYGLKNEALVLPKSLKYIAKGAFSRCSLRKVIVPESCIVEAGAFDSECKVIVKNAQNSANGSGDALEKLTGLANSAIGKIKGLWDKFKK